MMDMFYYCSLDADDKDCPRKSECKRYVNLQTAPEDNRPTAKLYNICEKNDFHMFMKLDKKESDSEESLSK